MLNKIFAFLPFSNKHLGGFVDESYYKYVGRLKVFALYKWPFSIYVLGFDSKSAKIVVSSSKIYRQVRDDVERKYDIIHKYLTEYNDETLVTLIKNILKKYKDKVLIIIPDNMLNDILSLCKELNVLEKYERCTYFALLRVY